MKILGIAKNINIKQGYPGFITVISDDKVKNFIKHKQISEIAETVPLSYTQCLYYLLTSIDELEFANELLNYCHFKFMYNSLLALKIDEVIIENEMMITANECEFDKIIFKDYISPYKIGALNDFDFFNCSINKLVLENSFADVTDKYILDYFKEYNTSIKEIIRI